MAHHIDLDQVLHTFIVEARELLVDMEEIGRAHV